MQRLRNWKIVDCRSRSGGSLMRLHGHVYGNPRYPDGAVVTTSTLYSFRRDGKTVAVITRSGSEYLLGEPLATDPAALPRLLRQLETQSVQRLQSAATQYRQA
jgi:hypothetical protein